MNFLSPNTCDGLYAWQLRYPAPLFAMGLRLREGSRAISSMWGKCPKELVSQQAYRPRPNLQWPARRGRLGLWATYLMLIPVIVNPDFDRLSTMTQRAIFRTQIADGWSPLRHLGFTLCNVHNFPGDVFG
jgi:hypothetical protein